MGTIKRSAAPGGEDGASEFVRIEQAGHSEDNPPSSNAQDGMYPASPIKRRKATRAEMEERAKFLIAYAREHGPVTVRGLYYQAEVHGLPGIDKTDNGYNRVQ